MLSGLSTTGLRRGLLSVRGVGPETADAILLYAFGRPVFVIDAYTRRIFARLGAFSGEEPYEVLRQSFEAAMGGPPVVLWVMAHRWSNRQTRAFMLALFMLAAPLQLTLLYLFSGGAILEALLSGLAFVTLVALGSTLGVQLGDYIVKDRLRQIAYGILLVTAVVSVMAPVLG